MTKSPVALAKVALQTAKDSLPAYSHPFSPKRFTQHQLFAILVLRQFMKTDYRGVIQMLNPKSKGKWIKAHLVLPEGFVVEDVNTNSPARIVEPFTADSNYMDVFLNEDGLVKIMAAFDRAVFCSNGSAQGNVVVIGRLTNGQYFYGTDTIRIKTNNLEYLAVLTSYWLAGDCGEPDWCAGADLNRDSVVDFIDFAFFDGCCLEFIKN